MPNHVEIYETPIVIVPFECKIFWKNMKGLFQNIQNWTSRVFWSKNPLKIHERPVAVVSFDANYLEIHESPTLFNSSLGAGDRQAMGSFQLGLSETIRHVTEAFAEAKKETETLVLTGVTSATMSCARTQERDDNGAGIISVLPIGSFRGWGRISLLTSRQTERQSVTRRSFQSAAIWFLAGTISWDHIIIRAIIPLVVTFRSHRSQQMRTMRRKAAAILPEWSAWITVIICPY